MVKLLQCETLEDKHIKIILEKNQEYLNDAFKLACCSGKLDTVKWLWDLSIKNNIPININHNNNEAFLFTCYSGHFEILKWLWDKSIEINSPINIHANDDLGFRLSCTDGNLDIAKFLLDLSKEINSPIDVRNDKDIIFIITCDNAHLDVAEWLCKICPYYKINIVNNQIRYNILSELPKDYNKLKMSLLNDEEIVEI